MVIRIDLSAPDGDGMKVQATLVADKDPNNPVDVCQGSWHFEPDTSPVAALTQIQKELSERATLSMKQQAFLRAFSQGSTFAAKTEAEARVFLGMD